jgi:hypothetical protein
LTVNWSTYRGDKRRGECREESALDAARFIPNAERMEDDYDAKISAIQRQILAEERADRITVALCITYVVVLVAVPLVSLALL